MIRIFQAYTTDLSMESTICMGQHDWGLINKLARLKNVFNVEFRFFDSRLLLLNSRYGAYAAAKELLA